MPQFAAFDTARPSWKAPTERRIADVCNESNQAIHYPLGGRLLRSHDEI